MKFQFGNIPSGLAGCDVSAHKQKSENSASDIKGCSLKEKNLLNNQQIPLCDKNRKLIPQSGIKVMLTHLNIRLR